MLKIQQNLLLLVFKYNFYFDYSIKTNSNLQKSEIIFIIFMML